MPQFFVKKSQINSSEILVGNPDDLKHLVSVLRIKKGDILNFIDEEEFVYQKREVKKKVIFESYACSECFEKQRSGYSNPEGCGTRDAENYSGVDKTYRAEVFERKRNKFEN